MKNFERKIFNIEKLISSYISSSNISYINSSGILTAMLVMCYEKLVLDKTTKVWYNIDTKNKA